MSDRISAGRTTHANDLGTFASAHRLLVDLACVAESQHLVASEDLGYVGGMVTHHSTKVSRGQVVVRGLDLPDGTVVTVSICRDDELPAFSKEFEDALEESIAQADRGEGLRGDEALAAIHESFRRAGIPPSAKGDRRGRRVVASKPRRRTKSARSAAR